MNTLSSLLNFIGGKIATHDDSIYKVKECDSFSEQVTLAGGAFGSVGAPIDAIEGYTPVAIVGIRKNGGNNNAVAISGYYINPAGTSAYMGLVNATSSSRTISVKVTILYKKDVDV